MDEALELGSYLPLSFKTKSEEEYIQFLWHAFQSNYTNGKYEFSSLAFHLLYMSFVNDWPKARLRGNRLFQRRFPVSR